MKGASLEVRSMRIFSSLIWSWNSDDLGSFPCTHHTPLTIPSIPGIQVSLSRARGKDYSTNNNHVRYCTLTACQWCFVAAVDSENGQCRMLLSSEPATRRISSTNVTEFVQWTAKCSAVEMAAPATTTTVFRVQPGIPSRQWGDAQVPGYPAFRTPGVSSTS